MESRIELRMGCDAQAGMIAGSGRKRGATTFPCCPAPRPSARMRSTVEETMDDVLERLTELEIRFSHQSLQLEEMNSELLAFGQRIERLEQENRRLREMLGGMAPELIESPDEWSP